jgi:hypothetical protein
MEVAMSAMRALAWPEDQADGRAVATWTVPAQAARTEATRDQAVGGQARRGQAARGTAVSGHPARAQAVRGEPAHNHVGRATTARATAARGPAERGTGARGAAARGQAAAVPLRLTRRGRIVVAVAAALLVTLLSLLATGTAQATGHSLPSRGPDRNLTQVVVRPGQSLWSLAESADPNADPRLVMQQIAELNGLTSEVIMAGQLLWVPRG